MEEGAREEVAQRGRREEVARVEAALREMSPHVAARREEAPPPRENAAAPCMHTSERAQAHGRPPVGGGQL